MPETDAPRRPLRLLFPALAFVVLQLVYAQSIARFHGPDEEEHLAYVRALADEHRLPVLPTLPIPVPDPASGGFKTDDRPTGLPGPSTPQAQHPPLAAAVYAVWYRAVRLLGLPAGAVRWVGALWGLAAMALLALAAREVFDDRPLLALLPLTVLLPGPVYLCAVVTNDGAALAVGALILWRLLRLFRVAPDGRDTVLLGLSVGLGLLTKSSLLVTVPFALGALLWSARRAGDYRRTALLKAVCCAAAMVLPVGWWWLRNVGLYGTPLVRAHARPILFTVAEAFSNEDSLYLVVYQICMTLFFWFPMTVAPLWLILRLFWVALGVYFAVWAVPLAAAVGLRSWRLTDPSPRATAALRFSGGLVAVMVVLYVHQFLFQDTEVALFGGRYFMAIYGAVMIPILAGFEAGLNDRSRALAGRGLPYLMAAASAAFVTTAANPP